MSENDEWKRLFEGDDSSEVEIELTEDVPNRDLVIDNDEIYETDMYQALLRELPVEIQSKPDVQQKLYDQVRMWVDLKNMGKQRMSDGVRDDPLYQNMLNGIWNSSWWLPVVLDQRSLYVTSDEFESFQRGETDAERIRPMIQREGWIESDPRGWKLAPLDISWYQHVEREEKYRTRKLTYGEFVQGQWDELQTFLQLNQFDADSDEIGVSLESKQDGTVMRYWDITTGGWDRIPALSKRTEVSDVLDDEGRLVDHKTTVVTSGQMKRVMGIARLPRPSSSTASFPAIGSANDMNSLYKALEGEVVEPFGVASRFRKVADVTRIEYGDATSGGAIFHAKNHGLSNGQRIMLQGFQKVPVRITGVYIVRPVDDDRFTVNLHIAKENLVVNKSKDEVIGSVVTYAKIQWVMWEYTGDEKNPWIWKQGPAETETLDPLKGWDYPYLYLATQKSLSEDGAWEKFLKQTIPAPEQWLEVVGSIPWIERWNETLMPMGIAWHDIPEVALQKWWEDYQRKQVRWEDATSIANTNNEKNAKKPTNENTIPMIEKDPYVDDAIFLDAEVEKVYGVYPFREEEGRNAPRWRRDWLVTRTDHGQWYQSWYVYRTLQMQLSGKSSIEQLKKQMDGWLKQLEGAIAKRASMKEKEKSDKLVMLPTFTYQYEDGKQMDNELESLVNVPEGTLGLLGKETVLYWTGDDWIVHPTLPFLSLWCSAVDTDNQGKQCEGVEGEVQLIADWAKEEVSQWFDAQLKMVQKTRETLNVMETMIRSPPSIPFWATFSEKEVTPREEEKQTEVKYEDEWDERVRKLRDQYELHERLPKVLPYFLIEGFRLGNRIKSLKTGKSLGCVHEWDYWDMVLQPGLRTEQRIQRSEDFKSKYGKEQGSEIYCSECGYYLMGADFDGSDSYLKTGSGGRDVFREVWTSTRQSLLTAIQEKTQTLPADADTGVQANPLWEAPQTSRPLPSCKDPDFQQKWIAQGNTTETLEIAREGCQGIQQFTEVLGLQTRLNHQGFWDTLGDYVDFVRNRPKFTVYASQLLTDRKRKGLDVNIPQDVIQKLYDADMLYQRHVALIARLHLWVQTQVTIPEPQSVQTRVQFQGWEDASMFWALMISEMEWDRIGNRRIPMERLQNEFQKYMMDFESSSRRLERAKREVLEMRRIQESRVTQESDEEEEPVTRSWSFPILKNVEGISNDLSQTWGDEWKTASTWKQIQALRQEGSLLQTHLIALLHDTWMRPVGTMMTDGTVDVESYAPDTVAEQAPFGLTDEFVQEMEKLHALDGWLGLRPNPARTWNRPLETVIPRWTHRNSDLNEASWLLEAKQRFLEVVAQVYIFEGVHKGQKHSWNADDVDELTGEKKSEIQIPSWDAWQGLEDELARKTAQKIPTAMDEWKEEVAQMNQMDTFWTEQSSVFGTYHSRQDWFAKAEEEWKAEASSLWNVFVKSMQRWREGLEEERFVESRARDWWGKFVMSGPFGYQQSMEWLVGEGPIVPTDKEAKKMREEGVSTDGLYWKPSWSIPSPDSSNKIQRQWIKATQNRIWEIIHGIRLFDRRARLLIVRSEVPWLEGRQGWGTSSLDTIDSLRKSMDEQWEWIGNWNDEKKKMIVEHLLYSFQSQQMSQFVTRVDPRDWLSIILQDTKKQETITKLNDILHELQEPDKKCHQWCGILYGVWMEWIATLVNWMKLDWTSMLMEKFGDTDSEQANRWTVDFIMNVQRVREQSLLYEHLPETDEEESARFQFIQSMRREREQTASQALQSYSRMYAKIGEEDLTAMAEMDMEATAQRDAEEQERKMAVLREQNPNMSDKELLRKLDSVVDLGADEAEESAFTEPVYDENGHRVVLGTEYGEDAEDIDEVE